MESGFEYKKGLWNAEEDRILVDYVKQHGVGKWNRIAKLTGLKRCGKSCRLRWMNYLSPNVKRGDFSEEEDDLIIRLHNLLGNRWSLIAGRVPGRTDNHVKNYWNTRLSKKVGVNKKRKPKLCQPLKLTSDEPKDVTPNVSSNPSTGPSDCSEKGDEVEKFVEVNTEYFPNMQEVIMNDLDFEFESAFWFPNDTGLGLYSTSFSGPDYDCLVDLDLSAL